MKTSRLSILALTCPWLLAAQLSSLAQAALAPAAAPLSNTAMVSSSDASVPSLEDLGLPAASTQSGAQSTAKPPAQTQETTQDQKTPPNTAPSLQDLGFSADATQGSAQQQALLNKRTHMLKVHQTLGLITLAPMVGTLVASGGAKAKGGKGSSPVIEPSTANLDLHAALGGLTAGMYFATAYYAIRAPKVPGTETRGAIRLHKELTWIHGPGMILTPILGILAYNQENQGERVHGVASAHAPVAWVTVAAYGASIVAVSWPIRLKFWESR